MLKKALLFTHTHWDLQWYLSRSELLEYLDDQLKYLFDSMEKGIIKYFTFDGQVAPILEFLRLHPEYEEKIRRLVEEKRLEIGPWYTQPDLYLVNGESLIRNLVIGMVLGEKLGGVLKVVYTPDSFGHVPQIPQILAKLGIRTYVYGRGTCHDVVKHGADFRWRAPDGSEVNALFLVKSYWIGTPIGIPEEQVKKLWTRLPIRVLNQYTHAYRFFRETVVGVVPDKMVSDAEKLGKELSTYYRHDIVPIPVGVDQYIPRRDWYENIDKALEGLRKAGLEPIYSGLRVLEEYKLPENTYIFEGELRCARYQHILWAVPSTRITIKQLSSEAELLIQAYLEPLIVFSKSLKAYEPSHQLLREAWIKLLHSQFHDAICGTVTDHVAEKVEAELRESIETARQLIHNLTYRIISKLELDKNTILLYNPLPYQIVNKISVMVPGRLPEDIGIDNRRLDHRGEVLRELGFNEYSYIASLPPLSITVHELTRIRQLHVESSIGSDEKSIWNEYIKVVFNDSDKNIVIKDLRTNTEYTIKGFIDRGDYGDLYDYGPPVRDEIIGMKDFTVEKVETMRGYNYARLQVKGFLRVPKDSNLEKRSEEKTSLPITMVFEVYDKIPRVEVRITVENKALNHVLMLRFARTPGSEIIRDLAFMVTGLPERNPDLGDEIEPRNTVFQYWIGSMNNRGGFIIATRGLHEAFIDDENIDIVLYRSVGILSRSDLPTRKQHAGPALETPGAQYLNTRLIFELAIIPFTAEEWRTYEVFKQVEAYLKPPLAVYVPEEYAKGSNREYTLSLVEFNTPLILSAFKPREPERGEGIIVRVYNPVNETIELSLPLIKDYEVFRISLDERVISRLEGKVKVKPYSIETLLLTRKK